MILVNLLVAFAVLAFFGHALALFAYVGGIGYAYGWWGAGPVEITAAVLLALLLVIGVVRAVR